MKYKHILLLICISVLPLVSIFHPGLPVTHDGQDHVARIANFYQSLSEGNIVPRWGANLNWGYGHPILMFLYPLPSYAASMFHAFGFSLVDSTKLVFGVAYVASVLTMYLWLKRAWGAGPGFVGATLYGFAPYRFVDLYVRGALGEHVAFVFPPLICWGLVTLATKRDSLLAKLSITLGTASLLLSHNALSLMFLPLIFLYVMYLFFFESKKSGGFLIQSLWLIALGFSLSAYFWVPAFFEGKYTLRDILTKGEFTNRFIGWIGFVTSAWNYGGGNEFSKEIGSLHWVGILGALVVFFKTKAKKVRVMIAVLLMSFLTSLYIMTETSRFFWSTITVMQKFQFPWRFLSVAVFISAVLGSIVINQISKRFTVLVCVIISSLAIIQTVNMWHPVAYKVYTEDFFTGTYKGTTDTGESSPIWSVRFMEKQAEFPVEAITGQPSILLNNMNTIRHVFTVQSSSQSRVVDNTLYFPGWNVFIDGQRTSIEFQDPSFRGLITFIVPPGRHSIVVAFSDTKVRTFANMISLIGVSYLVLLLVKLLCLKKT